MMLAQIEQQGIGSSRKNVDYGVGVVFINTCLYCGFLITYVYKPQKLGDYIHDYPVSLTVMQNQLFGIIFTFGRV